MAGLARRVLPRSLLGRTLLMVLLPLVIVMAVATENFYGNHVNLVSRRMAAAVTGEIATTVALIERAPGEADRDWALLNAWDQFEIRMELLPPGPLPRAVPPGLLAPRNNGLGSGLRAKLPYPIAIDWEGDPLSVIVTIQMPEGNLRIEAPRKRLFPATFPLFAYWVAGSSMLVFAIATLFVRNQVRSIRRLAAAAEAFGLGREQGPIKPEGAIEVRRAASAFNRMQERVSRFLHQRTEMLAGVSHDLRTPLTRLRLALAMLPADQRAAQDVADMEGDLDEMERLVDSYLAFARGEGAEQARPVDLAAMLGDITSSARRGGSTVAFTAEAGLTVNLRADAFRRAVSNLVDNAGRHAAHVTLVARRVSRNIEVTVDDDGPGIPPEQRENAFKPFESASHGGTGLGLAIARDIVRAHGGEITLDDSPMGGLRARILVPA